MILRGFVLCQLVDKNHGCAMAVCVSPAPHVPLKGGARNKE